MVSDRNLPPGNEFSKAAVAMDLIAVQGYVFNGRVHAHITLADENQKSYGGHLAAGTIVFACEVVIYSFKGPEFMRDYDEETGLPLWKLD